MIDGVVDFLLIALLELKFRGSYIGFLQVVFYYIGWPFVKLITLGKWPDKRI
jgi:hypothetical protein